MFVLRCNSEYLVSASNDLSLKLWRYSVDGDGKGQLRVKQTATGVHSKDINAVTVSPKDRFIATASQDRTAKVSHFVLLYFSDFWAFMLAFICQNLVLKLQTMSLVRILIVFES